MDGLLWSVRPKTVSEDRRQLISRLPNLIKEISSGLAPLKLQPKDTERFFSQLAKIHVANLYKDTPLGDKTSTQDVLRLELSSSPRGGDREIVPDEPNTRYTSVEPAAQPSQTRGEEGCDSFTQAANSLRIGSWVEFIGSRGHKSELRLEWMSQLKNVCVFMNRQGEGTMSISTNRLASRLRDGSARLLSSEPLTARAVQRLLDRGDAAAVPPPH